MLFKGSKTTEIAVFLRTPNQKHLFLFLIECDLKKKLS